MMEKSGKPGARPNLLQRATQGNASSWCRDIALVKNNHCTLSTVGAPWPGKLGKKKLPLPAELQAAQAEAAQEAEAPAAEAPAGP